MLTYVAFVTRSGRRSEVARRPARLFCSSNVVAGVRGLTIDLYGSGGAGSSSPLTGAPGGERMSGCTWWLAPCNLAGGAGRRPASKP